MKPESAECLIRKHPAFVDQWLTTIPGTAAERRLTRPAEAYFTSCFPLWPNAYASTWNLAGIRNGLMHTLLQRRSTALPTAPPAGLARSAWYPAEQALDAAAGPMLVANDLGFCLARADWPTTRLIVLASAGSEDERAGLRRLVPFVAGCIPPGRKLTLDTSRLRAILIETIYHATS